MKRTSSVRGRSMRLAGGVAALALLAACEGGPDFSFLQPKDKGAETGSSGAAATGEIERDVEAPDVFQVSEAGLWDGRPSLGGVWVAHPDVTDPERVMIVNTANNKSVVGALFRRERELPGPRIQASSDAASALGMLAGAPVQLSVTALRRETVAQAPEPEAAPLESGDDITETALDPIAGAAAAIEAPDPSAPDPSVVSAATAAATPAAPEAKPRTSPLSKPYIQIGIFSVEANAERTANQMRSAGMEASVLAQTANDKPFWRVVVGPAQSSAERTSLLRKVKETGFSDAYIVSN